MIKLKVSDLLIDSKRWGKIPSQKDPYHTVGWVVKYCGKEYGDFVTIADGLTDEILKECADILTEHINDTFKLICQKESGLDWKIFATGPFMELSELSTSNIKIIKE